MPQNTYEFFYGKPGLFLEIYLPKKAQFQGLHFDVLNKGSDLPVVREHFRSSVVSLKLRHLSVEVSLFTTKRTKDTKNGELD